MRDFLLAKRKEEKALKKKKKAKSKGKHKDETPEERAARKARKKAKKAKKEQELKSDGVRGVEELLKSLDQRHFGPTTHEERSREDGDRRLRSRECAPRGHDRRRSRSRDISVEGRHRSGSPISDQRSKVQYHRRPEERDRPPYEGGRYVPHRRQGRSWSPNSDDRAKRRSRTPEEGDRYSSSRRY